MYTLLKPLRVRDELLKRGIRIFTPQLFAQVFGSIPTSTKYFMETQTDEGLFSRLKKGLYTLKTDLPSEEEIANALYRPSYISFEYALAYYNMLPEMPYEVTSATTKPTRLFSTETLAFSYRTIKTKAYTGYSLVKKDNRMFLLAEPEKALVDYLYFVCLNRAAWNDRLLIHTNTHVHNNDGMSKKKIVAYAALFNNSRLNMLIKQYI